ncbi:MAG TPA: lipopolysaccharide biosynthesis protein, partial [Micromonospora sp.]
TAQREPERAGRPDGAGADGAAEAGAHRAKVRSAIGWSYLLTAGRVGSSVLVTFLLAKLLGPGEFGLLAMALVFITIAQTVLQQGLVSAIVQRDRLTADHLDAAFAVLVLAGLAVTLLTVAVSPLWAWVNQEPELTVICVALAPLVLFQGFSVVPEALLRRELRFRAVAVRTLLAAVLSGIVGIGLALAGAGVWALVGQQLVNAVVSMVAVWTVCRWRPSRRPRLGAIRDLWVFSAHSANAGIGLMLSTRLELIFSGVFFGPVATGIYRLAARLPDMLVDVTVRSLQQVALPSLSRLQHDRAALAAHLTQLQHLGAVAGLPVLGVLSATAGPLVDFLGPQWAGTETPLRLLCLFGAVNVYGVLLGPALQAVGRPGRLALITWTRGALGVAALAALGTGLTVGDPAGQASAVAVAGVVLQVLVNSLALWLTVHREIGASLVRFVLPTLPAVLAGGCAAGVPVVAGWLGLPGLDALIGVLVLGTLSALAAGLALWVADRRLRTQVLTRLRRRTAGTPVPEA